MVRTSTRSPAERGAALVVGLVLLVALTLVALTGSDIATLEARMAGNTQAIELAFQAAETGIEIALSGPVNADTPVRYPMTWLGDGGYGFEGTIECVAITRVPEGAYSEAIGVRAIHFDATFTGRGPRLAESVHTQSVYIVGPGPQNPHFDPDGSPNDC